MAGWQSSIFDRLMPEDESYTERDKRSLLAQGLLAMAAGMQSTNNFGGGLAEGTKGLLGAMNTGANDLSDRRYRQQRLKKGVEDPQGFRQLDMTARAAGYEPGSDEYKKMMRVAGGLEGRASNAGYGFEMIKGADGRERPARQNPRTGAMEIYDENSGDFVPMGGLASPSLLQSQAQPQERQISNFQARDESTGQPITDPAELAEIQAAITAPSFFQAGAPRPRRANPSLAVSRAPEEQAGLTTAAQEAAKTAYLGQQEAIKAQYGTAQALNTAQGQAQISSSKERGQAQYEKDQALRVYDEAMKGLTSGLDAAATGPIVGRLPALTSGQQMAEGSVAAMAPVLKQLFRTAGEGTFTDKDQQLLVSMLPTRTDTPAARQFKMTNIDNIVRAKLQAAPAGSARRPMTAQPRKPMEKKPKVLRYNPATGDFD